MLLYLLILKEINIKIKLIFIIYLLYENSRERKVQRGFSKIQIKYLKIIRNYSIVKIIKLQENPVRKF